MKEPTIDRIAIMKPTYEQLNDWLWWKLNAPSGATHFDTRFENGWLMKSFGDFYVNRQGKWQLSESATHGECFDPRPRPTETLTQGCGSDECLPCLLVKQAEAVEGANDSLRKEINDIPGSMLSSKEQHLLSGALRHIEQYAQRLRQQAAESEGDR